jgi:hypothetical protein
LYEELILPAQRHKKLDGVVPIDLQRGIGAQIPLRYVLAHLGIHPEYGDVDGKGGTEWEEGGDHVGRLGQVRDPEAVRGHDLHLGGKGGGFRSRA